MRLIDADEYRKNLSVGYMFYMGDDEGKASCYEGAMADLDQMPTIEANPVVRAHWQTVEGHGGCQCSHCGCWDLGRTVYCPHCGALMTEQQPEMEGFMPLLQGGKPVELAPVVHAHWEVKAEQPEYSYVTIACSNCKNEFTIEANNNPMMKFCTECGAKMDEEVSANA